MLQTNTDLAIVLICNVQCFTSAVNISGAHVNYDKVVSNIQSHFSDALDCFNDILAVK